MTNLPEIDCVELHFPGPAPDETATEPDEFLRDSHGVIHVGANVGQERGVYAALGLPVVWIEPVPGIFEVLAERVKDYPNQRALQCLVTDADGEERDLLIANNGVSNSVFPLAKHTELWPHIELVARVRMKTRTLDSIVREHGIDVGLYDTLILDVQGAELLVLRGAGQCLRRFRWVRAEVADFESYAGCCQLKDLTPYLFDHGLDLHALYRWQLGDTAGKNYFEALYRRA